MTPKPGELYWGIALDAKPRPVIVVSREEFNRGEYLSVVPVTSAHFARRSKLPTCVAIHSGQFGLIKNCVAQAEQLTLLLKSDVDLERGPIGVLDGEANRKLIRAIGHVIAAECEPTSA